MIADRLAEEEYDKLNPVNNTWGDDSEGLSYQETKSVLHAIRTNLQLSDESPTESWEEDEAF